MSEIGYSAGGFEHQRDLDLPGETAGFNDLWPFGSDVFFSDFWSKSSCLVRGSEGGFSNLMPWPDLNEIIHSRSLEDLRIRVVKQGVDIQPDEYSISQHAPPVRARVDPVALAELLREGATLIIGEVDHLHPGLERFVSSFEATLRELMQVTLYAGWNQAKGFNVHWDDHDVYILQIHGAKKWSLYGQTRMHPGYRDVLHEETPPEVTLWEGLLRSGDLLYIPRGEWHSAEAVSGPTLHLTLGVRNRTGADLIKWLSDLLLSDDFIRGDVPFHSSPETMAKYCSDLKGLVSRAVTPESLVDFRQHGVDSLMHRIPTNLPFSVYYDGETLEGCTLRWAAYPSASLQVGAETISIAAYGKKFKFSSKAGVLLNALRSSVVVEFDVLLGLSNLPRLEVEKFVVQLARLGLVEVTELAIESPDGKKGRVPEKKSANISSLLIDVEPNTLAVDRF